MRACILQIAFMLLPSPKDAVRSCWLYPLPRESSGRRSLLTWSELDHMEIWLKRDLCIFCATCFKWAAGRDLRQRHLWKSRHFSRMMIISSRFRPKIAGMDAVTAAFTVQPCLACSFSRSSSPTGSIF